MPKFEFIGTRGSGPAEMHLFRDEHGQVMEIPAAVANPAAKETAERQHGFSNEIQAMHNVARADHRGQASLYPPLYDVTRMSRPEQSNLRARQDADQVQRNRANIANLDAYKSQVLAANPSPHAGPTAPGSMAPVPPADKLSPQPTFPAYEGVGKTYSVAERADRANKLGRTTAKEREAIDRLLNRRSK